MPRWIRRYLHNKDLNFHFKVALLAGAVARGLCAFFVYGPQALDDYKHAVLPAYQFFAGLPVDLPDYRSHLLVWLLAGFLKIASWFGVESALAQVRAMYFGLGSLSLLAVVGTYLYVRNFRSRLFGALALYLVALFPIMPFAGTRAFGEAVALSLVVLAFGVFGCTRGFAACFLGFLILGLATLFRFHVGVIYLSYMFVLLYQRYYKGVAAGIIAGLLTGVAEILIDILSHKGPLATLLIYMAENEGGAARYGVSPWYNPLLFVLALTLAPFSFVLARGVPQLWRRHWPVIVPFLVFLVAHCLAAHKEERFLYPIVGLQMWFLAWLWAAAARNKLARTIYARAILILGVPLLFVICLVNTQEGEIEPAAYAESHFKKIIYLENESLFGQSRYQFYFLRPPSLLRAVGLEAFNAERIEAELAANPDHAAVVLLTSRPDGEAELHAMEDISTGQAQCHQLRRAGSLIDRLLYSLNPKHNQRRRPTWYLVCTREKIS